MPPSFRLGLIGAGRMGRTHLRAFAGSAAFTTATTTTLVAAIAGTNR